MANSGDGDQLENVVSDSRAVGVPLLYLGVLMGDSSTMVFKPDLVVVAARFC